jgi:ABC-type uncharacterized transport system substrate-binding protein
MRQPPSSFPTTGSLVAAAMIALRRSRGGVGRGILAVCLALVLWGAGAPGASTAHAGPVVTVLLSEPGGIYQAAADRLVRELSRAGEDWKLVTTTPERYPLAGSQLTVALGTKALEAALTQPARPVLSLLVPRLTYERLVNGRREVSALHLDQPLTRQLQLLALALPGMRQAGVPLGPSSRKLQPELIAASRDSGVQVGSVIIEEGTNLYDALTSLAVGSQAFVLLPDPVVIQRGALQNFFLHTYRLRKPVLAYSEPLVKAGALLALHATPEQIGEEAAEWVHDSWIGGQFQLGLARYPKRFTVSVNRTVARSLDIPVASEDALAARLEALQ